MLTITIQVNAPTGSAQGIKESLAMYLERFGDAKILSVKEELPQQTVMQGMQTNNTPRRR